MRTKYTSTLTYNGQRRMCRRAMVLFGGGYSYRTAISKVARRHKLSTDDMVILARDVFSTACDRKQLTRKQARDQFSKMTGMRL